jgi:hypothetical protein
MPENRTTVDERLQLIFINRALLLVLCNIVVHGVAAELGETLCPP